MSKKMLEVNPWISIWFKPRDTVRKIVNTNPKSRFFILSFLYGLPMLLHIAQNLSLGENYTSGGIWLFAAILATFVGMLGITISSGLIYWTGSWIGGKSDYYGVRAAVSWSNVPNIIAIIIWGVLFYFFRDQVFYDNFEQTNFTGSSMMIVSTAFFVQAVISIWAFIMLVKGLGEVQGFSAWKGVLNVLIPFFMVGIIVWLISWLVWMGNGVAAA